MSVFKTKVVFYLKGLTSKANGHTSYTPDTFLRYFCKFDSKAPKT